MPTLRTTQFLLLSLAVGLWKVEGRKAILASPAAPAWLTLPSLVDSLSECMRIAYNTEKGERTKQIAENLQ